jgi:GDSL-like Lipase/Acylhydrolase family
MICNMHVLATIIATLVTWGAVPMLMNKPASPVTLHAAADGSTLAAPQAAPPPVPPPVPMAILGDSDAHAYQQPTPPGGPARFGVFESVTLQWPEVLARLRPGEIDLGPWGARGMRRSLAEVMDWVGLRGRFPPKHDYLHNLAFGGARCDSLSGYDGRLVRRLLAQMDLAPAMWQRGVVVISLGVNDFGHGDNLDRLASNAKDPLVLGKIERCLAEIGAAVRSIHSRHAQTRVLLVGILGDVIDPSNHGRWQSAPAISNIDAGLDVFDKGLQALATADPRVAFVSQRQWCAATWGLRDANGRPQYKTVAIGEQFSANNHKAGNDPKHALTGDEHTGVVWNTLWAKHLIEVMRQSWRLPITALSDDEVAKSLAPAIALSR